MKHPKKRKRTKNYRSSNICRPLMPSSTLLSLLSSTIATTNSNHETDTATTTAPTTTTTTSKSQQPSPSLLLHNSRKKARKITTLFHKYTKEREEIVRRLQKYRTSSNVNKDDLDGENEYDDKCNHKDDNNNVVQRKVSADDEMNDEHHDNSSNVDDDDDHDEKYDINEDSPIILLQKKLDDIDDKIQLLGGRKQYQRASQINTSYYSTSKWIIGYLRQCGWLYGRPAFTDINHPKKTRTKERQLRTTHILEIGAINLDLWNAANAMMTATTTSATNNCTTSGDHHHTKHDDYGQDDHDCEQQQQQLIQEPTQKKKYNIQVRAIDIHSMYPNQIEEIDFFTLIQQYKQPQHQDEQVPIIDNNDRNNYPLYDVIVCSMVLNCLPTSHQRGEMIYQCYHTLLCDDGILFMIIPKTCLLLSSYITVELFEQFVTQIIGFTIIRHTKISPKLLYYVLQKQKQSSSRHDNNSQQLSSQEPKQNVTISTRSIHNWTHQPPRIIRHRKKYRNPFAITLPTSCCLQKHDEKEKKTHTKNVEVDMIVRNRCNMP